MSVQTYKMLGRLRSQSLGSNLSIAFQKDTASELPTRFFVADQLNGGREIVTIELA